MNNRPQHLAVREQRQVNPPLQPAPIPHQDTNQFLVGHCGDLLLDLYLLF